MPLKTETVRILEECKHGNQAARDILDKLPDSQAGTGRHKCAVCAYEAGVLEGVRRATTKLEEMLERYLQAAPRQPDDTPDLPRVPVKNTVYIEP